MARTATVAPPRTVALTRPLTSAGRPPAPCVILPPPVNTASQNPLSLPPEMQDTDRQDSQDLEGSQDCWGTQELKDFPECQPSQDLPNTGGGPPGGDGGPGDGDNNPDNDGDDDDPLPEPNADAEANLLPDER